MHDKIDVQLRVPPYLAHVIFRALYNALNDITAPWIEAFGGAQNVRTIADELAAANGNRVSLQLKVERDPEREDRLSLFEWLRVLGVKRRHFLERIDGLQIREERSYGLVPMYAARNLPKHWQERVCRMMEQKRLRTCRELLLVTIAGEPVPARSPQSFPVASRRRAEHVAETMQVYFAALENGDREVKANRIACERWRAITGRAYLTDRSVRRWASNIVRFGGPEHTPLLAYFDAKSSPHPAARKAKRTNSARA